MVIPSLSLSLFIRSIPVFSYDSIIYLFFFFFIFSHTNILFFIFVQLVYTL